MKSLPSKVLIGRKFWIKHKLQLDLRYMTGKIFVLGYEYGGSVGSEERIVQEEARQVIEDVDIEKALADMDLSEFSEDESMCERLRAVLLS